MNNNSNIPTSSESTDYPRPAYAWYVVIVLMICYTLSFVDRQILAFLVGPIKRDLHISDTQMGLLGGLAFALFYTLLGLPMGRLADSKSRRTIIAVGVLVWSLMTSLCSVARSYGYLFLTRIGVGVGEASLGPAAMSLISDYFPKERLGTALSVYSMGVMIGSGMASIVGGGVVQAVTKLPPVAVPLLGTMEAWRLTFLAVGLPGVVVALLLYTVREPRRRTVVRDAQGHIVRLPFAQAMAQIKLRVGSVAGVSLGMASVATCNYGVNFWAPQYFARVHHWTLGNAGLVLGSITIIAGCAGLLLGGRLCDRWLKAGLREAPLKTGLIGAVGGGICVVLAFAMKNPVWSAVLLAPGLFFIAFPTGSAYAALQWIFPNQVRGVVSALLLFILNLGGLTLGPFLPGFFNDHLFHDEQMVGPSIMLTVAIGAIVAAVLFRSTYASYRRDHALLEAQSYS